MDFPIINSRILKFILLEGNDIYIFYSEIEREREREMDNYGTVNEGATRVNVVDDTWHTLDHNFQDVSKLEIFFFLYVRKRHTDPSIPITSKPIFP